ncbi:hypothetical protein L6452_02994 [Arctium lappa]|uniref:Uncharacterized protein n=1 Tax=Arctium lappa TaxID=4217 RepID=A0ACB9FL06_ARCLA|nr:hypothetical protein L6452_02994 [Arctium lappa]
MVKGGRRRRRSFGGSSQADLSDFFACNGVKVVYADMPPYMQIHVVDVTRKTYDSLEKFTAKTLALTLKKSPRLWDGLGVLFIKFFCFVCCRFVILTVMQSFL